MTLSLAWSILQSNMQVASGRSIANPGQDALGEGLISVHPNLHVRGLVQWGTAGINLWFVFLCFPLHKLLPSGCLAQLPQDIELRLRAPLAAPSGSKDFRGRRAGL